MTPRHFTRITAVAVTVLAAATNAASAQNYPARPIRLVVPQAPGSASDNIARIVATELSKEIGQQVVVDNRPGGGFAIGMGLTAHATPDGYTLGYAPIGALAISPNMFRKPPYNPVKDFQPVALIATNQMLLAASPRHPFKTIREVVDFARQNPGKLLNASSASGSPGHVGFELFKLMAGVKIVHVPYKGGAAAILDLMSGQVHLMMESLNSITPHAKAGRVRGLGVTGKVRSPAVPDIPTIAEAGVPGYEATTWNGIVAPSGLPKPILAALNRDINKTLASATLKERFAAIGADPSPRTPEQFAELIRSEHAKWGDVVRRAGATID
jgi:tripartite-type tricarboxylate transporter receptor subunit TctC